jgi:hypothetical protein
MSQTAEMKLHFFEPGFRGGDNRVLAFAGQHNSESTHQTGLTPNQAAARHLCICRILGGREEPIMKKRLLAIATASLFTVGIATAQTATTSPTDNTSPADQSSPAALPNQGNTGTSGQPDSMGSASDQSGTTDQTSQSKKKKKQQNTNETPAGTDSSNTPGQSTPDSPTPSY